MDLTRRDLLKVSALASGAILLPLERRVLAADTNRIAESALPVPFTVPFAIPPRARPVRTDATTDFYALTMRESLAEILPGYRTRVWGFDGIFPGPTFDVQKGRPLVVRQINQLPPGHPILGYPSHTSVHLHGSASLPQFDGYASDLIPPGFYKDYRYPNYQGARTLWYHDHAVHRTSSNVYMGLAGMYRIHDALEQSLAIPQGAYDVPLVISDAMFAASGDLLWDNNDESSIHGDVILVNGRPWPVMKVERRKYRFRILNASVARSLRLSLDTGDPLVVIATDAGLMPAPQPVSRLLQSSAERYEVVIDFSKYRAGTRVVLRNESPKNNIDYPHTDKVMAFDVLKKGGGKQAAADLPPVLYPNDPTMALDPATAEATRVMEMVRTGGQWTINGLRWEDVVDSGFTLALGTPRLNAVEIWELRNDSGGWHHPLHIHLVDFRILDRQHDQTGPWVPPHPHELGPKDTVFLRENERVRIIAQFGPHQGKYMIHCHNLVHEDHDMMGQFIVGDGGPDPISTAPARPLPAPAL